MHGLNFSKDLLQPMTNRDGTAVIFDRADPILSKSVRAIRQCPPDVGRQKAVIVSLPKHDMCGKCVVTAHADVCCCASYDPLSASFRKPECGPVKGA